MDAEHRRGLFRRVVGRLATTLRRYLPSLDDHFQQVLRWLGFGVLPVPPSYFEDQLCTVNSHAFVNEPRFRSAYERGVRASNGIDHAIRWRVHTLFWVAEQAARLPGDFVECGVNTGFMSSAMLYYLNWDSLQKRLFLLDTFAGPVESQFSAREREEGLVEQFQLSRAAGAYQTSVESVRNNFSEWTSVAIIPGTVPETLSQVLSDRIAFLHLDMNCSAPEIAAAEYFWPLMVPSSYVLMDDYGRRGYSALRSDFDAFARRHEVSILSLPTGQGLMQKKPALDQA